MKLNTVRSLIGITLLSSAFVTANAADTGFYVGGGLGSSYGSKYCDMAPEGTKCDDKDFAWKLFGGYQFNPVFGLEAFYADLGKFKVDGNVKDSTGSASFEVKSEMSGFGLAATAGWPINQQFSLFGKAGYVRSKAKYSFSGSVQDNNNASVSGSLSKDIDGNNFMAGAGIKYSFTENLSARLEWEFFKDIGKDDDIKIEDKTLDGTDIHLFSASLVYAF